MTVITCTRHWEDWLEILEAHPREGFVVALDCYRNDRARLMHLRHLDRLSRTERHWAIALNLVMENTGVGDAELASRLGISRSSVNHKCTGRQPLSGSDIDAYSTALGVEPVVFTMNAVEVLRWLADNRAELVLAGVNSEVGPEGIEPSTEGL